MSVTVVSCFYGTRHRRFVRAWAEAISALYPAADRVVVAGDDIYRIPDGDSVLASCPWRYPQAFYLNTAIALATTDWVWVVDIDDFAKPNALAGIEQVDADVWQMGFERSDGETYVPPQMSNDEYLASDRNVYVAGSAFRVSAFRRVGGFRDVALQDWDLWRRLAAAGATFQPSGRTHFHYMRHAYTRGATELTLDRRAEHLEEMRLVA